VDALALAGSDVFVGGRFTQIGGAARNNLAAIDATTGHVTSWDPNANDDVSSLAVSDGTIYAGGGFDEIGRQKCSRIAAISLASGHVKPWCPFIPQPGIVSTLVASASRLYVGGYFPGAVAAFPQAP
jgi:hypothetical protein